EDGAHLVDVERLALGEALLDVDERDVGVVAGRQHLRRSRADVPRADDCDLAPRAHARPSPAPAPAGQSPAPPTPDAARGTVLSGPVLFALCPPAPHRERRPR